MNKLGVIVFLIFFWLPEIGVAQESDYPLDWQNVALKCQMPANFGSA